MHSDNGELGECRGELARRVMNSVPVMTSQAATAEAVGCQQPVDSQSVVLFFFFFFFFSVDLGCRPPARAVSASVDNMQNCRKVSRKQIQFVRPEVIIMHEGWGSERGGLTKSLCSTRSKPSKELQRNTPGCVLPYVCASESAACMRVCV